jgi:hypothetical protein
MICQTFSCKHSPNYVVLDQHFEIIRMYPTGLIRRCKECGRSANGVAGVCHLQDCTVGLLARTRFRALESNALQN